MASVGGRAGVGGQDRLASPLGMNRREAVESGELQSRHSRIQANARAKELAEFDSLALSGLCAKAIRRDFAVLLGGE